MTMRRSSHSNEPHARATVPTVTGLRGLMMTTVTPPSSAGGSSRPPPPPPAAAAAAAHSGWLRSPVKSLRVSRGVHTVGVCLGWVQ